MMSIIFTFCNLKLKIKITVIHMLATLALVDYVRLIEKQIFF